jgi:hypothetical protein
MDPTKAIDQTDWTTFRTEVDQALAEAVSRYQTKHFASAGPIREFSIWTDVQAGLTCISIQTERATQERGGLRVRVGDAWVWDYPMPSDPSEFEFSEFGQVRHQCLAPLQRLDLVDPDVHDTVLPSVNAALREVRAEWLASGRLDPVREPRFWFGLNTADDWYGDLIAIDDRRS